jgi:hypothetical protein
MGLFSSKFLVSDPSVSLFGISPQTAEQRGQPKLKLELKLSVKLIEPV